MAKRPHIEHHPESGSVRDRIHEIIFEADTPAGRFFDVSLLVLIILSVLLVMAESVQWIGREYIHELHIAEWVITILFTIEYILRLYSLKKPQLYAKSFFGIVDLLSILPTYLSLILVGSQSLMVVRALRLLRIFRLFKMARYVRGMDQLSIGLRRSWPKIAVFLFFMLTASLIIGALMYVVEGEKSGFTSIPKGWYWAIVTITTVGFGDIAPITPLGQFFASLLMIMGYAIIAVPTGIVSVEISKAHSKDINTQNCPNCTREGHRPDAKRCFHCGEELNPEKD